MYYILYIIVYILYIIYYIVYISQNRWFAVKRTLPRGGRYKLSRLIQLASLSLYIWWLKFFYIFYIISYLPVYLWKQSNKVEQKDDFLELLSLMSARQMSEDADFDNTKVLNFFSLKWALDLYFSVAPQRPKCCPSWLFLLWCQCTQSSCSFGIKNV